MSPVRELYRWLRHLLWDVLPRPNVWRMVCPRETRGAWRARKHPERGTHGAMFGEPRDGGGSRWLWQFRNNTVARCGPGFDPPRGSFNAWDRSLGGRVWYQP
jgi:hypothetical protein